MLDDSALQYIRLLNTESALDAMGDDDGSDGSYTIPFNFTSMQKGAEKFKENVKFLVRNSIEYKQWTKWFRERYAPPICCLSGHMVTIEVHHHPLTLEDYVDVAQSLIYKNGFAFTSMQVADVIMRWHYQNLVGACFLCKTEHKNWHDTHSKTIPETAIQGNVIGLLQDKAISQFITEYHVSRIATYMPRLYTENENLFNSFASPGFKFDVSVW